MAVNADLLFRTYLVHQGIGNYVPHCDSTQPLNGTIPCVRSLSTGRPLRTQVFDGISAIALSRIADLRYAFPCSLFFYIGFWLLLYISVVLQGLNRVFRLEEDRK